MKTKKNRVITYNFDYLKLIIDKLQSFPRIKDSILGMHFDDEWINWSSSVYDNMVFNDDTTLNNEENSNFKFVDDTLIILYEGNYYNFWLDEKTKNI